jgi:hypothetical protein
MRQDQDNSGYNPIIMRRYSPWLLILLFLGLVGLVGLSLILGFRQVTQPVTELRDDLDTWMDELLHPSPTVLPDPVTIVREVRALARLETIQYTIEKVIIAETGQGPFGFLFGDRLLMVAHGTVIAGVDLGRIGPSDIWFDEQGRVYILLPEPEIFVAALDNDKSFVYDRDTGLFTRGDINLESTARMAAEAEIKDAALEDGILRQAGINAESYLFRLMRTLGIPDVIFAQPGDQPGTSGTAPSPVQTQTSGG